MEDNQLSISSYKSLLIEPNHHLVFFFSSWFFDGLLQEKWRAFVIWKRKKRDRGTNCIENVVLFRILWYWWWKGYKCMKSGPSACHFLGPITDMYILHQYQWAGWGINNAWVINEMWRQVPSWRGYFLVSWERWLNLHKEFGI